MALLTVQGLTSLLAADTYAAVSASDTFAASQGQTYVLRYVNGGTPSGSPFYIRAQGTITVAPSGSTPGIPAGAQTFADDLLIATTFPATPSRMAVILVDNYLASGLVTLLHGGTLTTVTLGIFGPV
jgi:hypothetical protein